MHQLTDQELYQAIEHARSINENTGRSIIESFQKDQAALAHSLFTVFPSMFSAKDQASAHIFMDLCFDLICIYQHVFGNMPAQNNALMQKQSARVKNELQAIMPNKKIDTDKVNQLQQGLAKPDNQISQPGLIQFMNQSIIQYSDEIAADAEAVQLNQTLIATVIRLFGEVYSQQ